MIVSQNFKLIDGSEKDSVLKHVIYEVQQVQIQGVNTKDIRILEKTENLFKTDAPTVLFKANEDISVSFYYQNEYYFFKTKVIHKNSLVYFNVDTQIYRLQRRANFRTAVPASINNELKITGNQDLKCTVIDISLGGCRFTLKNRTGTELKIGMELFVSLKVLDFEEKNIPSEIRFRKYDDKTNLLSIGIEFKKLTPQQTSELNSLILKLSRMALR